MFRNFHVISTKYIFSFNNKYVYKKNNTVGILGTIIYISKYNTDQFFNSISIFFFFLHLLPLKRKYQSLFSIMSY